MQGCCCLVLWPLKSDLSLTNMQLKTSKVMPSAFPVCGLALPFKEEHDTLLPLSDSLLLLPCCQSNTASLACGVCYRLYRTFHQEKGELESRAV